MFLYSYTETSVIGLERRVFEIFGRLRFQRWVLPIAGSCNPFGVQNLNQMNPVRVPAVSAGHRPASTGQVSNKEGCMENYFPDSDGFKTHRYEKARKRY